MESDHDRSSEICAAARRARVARDARRGDEGCGAEAIAAALEDATAEILEANAEDVEAGREAGLRTRWSTGSRCRAPDRGDGAGAREIAALPDPVGEASRAPPAGRPRIRKLRVPLGVVAVIYEARPNVTIDAAALCLKSGNAASCAAPRSAARSNAVLAASRRRRGAAGVPATRSRALGRRSRRARRARDAGGHVDLIIPRGGEGLKEALLEHATVPVIYAASGNCHVYVDAAADPDRGRDRASTRRPSAPGLQRGRDAARAPRDRSRLPARALAALHDAGVELRGDEGTRALAGRRPSPQRARPTGRRSTWR